MADTQQVGKVQTAFPGLHQANGVPLENIEVVTPNNPPDPAAQAQTPPDPPPRAEVPVFAPDNMSDEDFNAQLAKRTKGKVNTIEELIAPAPIQKTQAELDAEKEQRKANALTWALDNGKIKKEDYEKAIIGKSKTSRELALSIFTADQQAEDKDITAEEAAEIFADVYHENAEPGSRLYKAGQKEIEKLANAYRKEHFGAVDEIEPEYESFEQAQAQYKAYKGQIKKISSELPQEISFDLDYAPLNKDLAGATNKITYSIPVDEGVMKSLLADYNNQNAFALRNTIGDGKIDEIALAKELNYHLKAMMFDKVLPQMLQQHGEKVEELLLVELGNKRNGSQTLNDGLQPNGKPEQKKNVYTGLHKAMSGVN